MSVLDTAENVTTGAIRGIAALIRLRSTPEAMERQANRCTRYAAWLNGEATRLDLRVARNARHRGRLDGRAAKLRARASAWAAQADDLRRRAAVARGLR